MTSTNKQKLTVIISHIDADFDAIGSMIAAQKLYPNSIAVFSGSSGKTTRDFFLKSVAYLLNLVNPSKIDPCKIDRLIIVDTRKRIKLGRLAYLLDIKNIEIHIYDHHIRQYTDIKGTKDIYLKTGSTVTILVNIIEKKKLKISAEEATIMCMGIYEDTGSFLFSSTTVNDLKAASFLLSSGANLKVISSLIGRELNSKQIEMLNEMMHSIKKYNINELSINLVQITTDKYFPNLSFLVNKMMQIKRVEILFVLALMGNKTHIIARSKVEEVNVGKIMTILGGGGHVSAATVVLKNTTLPQAKYTLLETLNASIKPDYLAKNIVSSPAIILSTQTTCKKAQKYIFKYNINALIITKDGTNKTPIMGYITRQILEKALFHGLGNIQIKEYMTVDFAIVSINATIKEIKEKIILNKQRILPVIDKDNKILGVITRTDLLNLLTGDKREKNVLIPKAYQDSIKTRTKFVTSFIKERIEKKYLKILIELGHIATKLGYNLYVVGGFVRDLFLYHKNEDIDLVVEGSSVALVKKYASKNNVKIHIHKKFNTASIIFTDNFKIDIASSRMEYYKFPASLPIVEISSIKMDLFRRDFTMNTLAIQINPEKFGCLIDFFYGQKDIKNKIIRVLHNMSFVEDPTRVFRALRFEQRFDFVIGKLTSSLIKNAIKMGFFEQLSGKRVFNELKLIMQEKDPAPIIIKLFNYGILKTILPEEENIADLKSILMTTKSVTDWQDLLFMKKSYEKWVVYFMIIIRNFSEKKSYKICEKMCISPRYKTMFCSKRFEAEKHLKYLESNKKLLNSGVFNILSGLKTEIIIYMMIITKSEMIRKKISHYQTKLRNTKINLSGKDLIHMDIKPGPVYTHILNKLLMSKLDKKIKSKQDEVELVKKIINL